MIWRFPMLPHSTDSWQSSQSGEIISAGETWSCSSRQLLSGSAKCRVSSSVISTSSRGHSGTASDVSGAGRPHYEADEGPPVSRGSDHRCAATHSRAARRRSACRRAADHLSSWWCDHNRYSAGRHGLGRERAEAGAERPRAPRATPHGLDVDGAGIDLHLLQRVAGHQDPAVTGRYLHPDRRALVAAGTAFSAWWANVGPKSQPLTVVKQDRDTA